VKNQQMLVAIFTSDELLAGNQRGSLGFSALKKEISVSSERMKV
jgi:hypothetical protein